MWHRIGTRLGMGFGLVILLIGVMSVVTIRYMIILSDRTTKLYRHPYTVTSSVLKIDADIVRMHRSMKDLVLSNTPSEAESALREVDRYERRVYENLDIVYESFLGDKSKVKAAGELFSAWRPIREEVAALVRSGKEHEAGEITKGRGSRHAASLNESIRFLRDFAQKKAEFFHKDSERTKNKALLTACLMAVLAVLSGAAVAFGITRSIGRSLRGIASGLADASVKIASASKCISSASRQLAEGASEQAASVQESSSLLEEISSMGRRSAANAGQTEGFVRQSGEVIRKANTSMSDLTDSMKRISESGENTFKIVGSIEDIAFQTNLLALNAAVEAARAGEFGTGFAVVADEVRNLAVRSSQAVRDTARLVEDIMEKINDGAELVLGVNEAFSRLSGNSSEIQILVSGIAAALNEQSQGMGEVNLAIIETDKVAQQNAANAEEFVGISEEMGAQAEQLDFFVKDLLKMTGRIH